MNKQTFVTVALALIVFTSGVLIGNMTASSQVGTELHAVTNAAKTGVTTDSTSTPPTIVTSSQVTKGQSATKGSDIAFTVSIANLPESQKAFLRTMGITGDTIPVSNTMFICAEAAVGTDRITAIKNGAVPSIGEGIKLAGCYKK